MSTNVNLEPAQIISYFVRRWQIEVTFAETRAHLGVETQRQWNDKAIMRTTPSLLGPYKSRHTLGLRSARSRRSSLCRRMVQENGSHSPMPSAPFAALCGIRRFIDTIHQTPTFPKSKQNASSA
ncbi:hypothetical protein ACOJBM_02015 [Rhizobium beringeri]